MGLPKIFSKLFKEPLLHFLIIGFTLFIFYAQINKDIQPDNPKKIRIEKSRLSLLTDEFIKKNSTTPTQKEKQTLLDNEIQDEILYYEALAMGLDKNDRVIRHRLVQKVKYIFEDMSMSDDLSNENKDFYTLLNSRYEIIINKDLKQEFNLSIPN